MTALCRARQMHGDSWDDACRIQSCYGGPDIRVAGGAAHTPVPLMHWHPCAAIGGPACAYLYVFLGRYCTDMHCYICAVSANNTYRYSHRYTHDTTECISDMHCAYLIHTRMYPHVSACICMYPNFPRDVSCAYLNVSLVKYIQIHADMY